MKTHVNDLIFFVCNIKYYIFLPTTDLPYEDIFVADKRHIT